MRFDIVSRLLLNKRRRIRTSRHKVPLFVLYWSAGIFLFLFRSPSNRYRSVDKFASNTGSFPSKWTRTFCLFYNEFARSSHEIKVPYNDPRISLWNCTHLLQCPLRWFCYGVVECGIFQIWSWNGPFRHENGVSSVRRAAALYRVNFQVSPSWLTQSFDTYACVIQPNRE